LPVLALISVRFLVSTTFEVLVAFLPRLVRVDQLNAIRNIPILFSVWVPPSYPSAALYDPSMPPEKLEKAKKREHYERRVWKVAWKNLSTMEGLMKLRVEIHIFGRLQYLWEASEFDCVKLVIRPQIQLVLPDMLAERIAGKIESDNCTVSSCTSVSVM